MIGCGRARHVDAEHLGPSAIVDLDLRQRERQIEATRRVARSMLVMRIVRGRPF